MALTYSYHDKFLDRLVDEEIEQRAASDVADVSDDFSAAWLAKLVPIRAYILVCQLSAREDGDIFSTKLAIYRSEWTEQLGRALRDTTSSTTGLTLDSLSVEIGRSS